MAAVGPNAPLATSIDMFEFDTGRLPNKLDELVTRPDDVRIANQWGGPYIRSGRGLLDPWGRPYRYGPPNRRCQSSFALWSMGPDGSSGTADDIANWDDDR
jgi:general secretion pathway protein G